MAIKRPNWCLESTIIRPSMWLYGWKFYAGLAAIQGVLDTFRPIPQLYLEIKQSETCPLSQAQPNPPTRPLSSPLSLPPSAQTSGTSGPSSSKQNRVRMTHLEIRGNFVSAPSCDMFLPITPFAFLSTYIYIYIYHPIIIELGLVDKTTPHGMMESTSGRNPMG